MIFFDIDDTLLDHQRAEEAAAFDFFKGCEDELSISETEFVKQWFSLSTKYFGRFLAKELSFQDQRRMRIRELFGDHLSNEQADCRFDSYLSFYKRHWIAFEDVIPCLSELKQMGFRLGIITNGDRIQQLEKLGKIEIRNYFDCMFTSNEIGVSKPNAMIFQEACQQAGVNTEDCYYVGDRLDIDAIASEDAGMRGIWINRKDKERHPEILTINNLNELKTIVT